MTTERDNDKAISDRADTILRIYTWESIDHMNTMLQKADIRGMSAETEVTKKAWNLAWMRARKSTGFKPDKKNYRAGVSVLDMGKL